jgi:hypothetical protein
VFTCEIQRDPDFGVPVVQARSFTSSTYPGGIGGFSVGRDAYSDRAAFP